jgi:TamB, inner membrane protein subunit of TAM complex
MPEDPTPAADTPEPPAPKPRRRRLRRLRWLAVRLLAVFAAMFAALIVVGFSVDLGPVAKKQAEVRGSKYLDRPFHIGKLSALLWPGEFALDDVVIEGLAPTDRPFLKAKRITVSVPWWTAFSHQLIIESVEMTDWTVVVETWPDSPQYPRGRHNLPRFKPEPKKDPKPSVWPLTTTLRKVLASRGSFTFEDHGAPWGTSATGVTIMVTRGLADKVYRGSLNYTDSVVRIMSYEPFRATLRSRFNLDGGQLHFTRIDLKSEGADSVMTGDIDFGRWPEQTYQIVSHIDFPTEKEIFFRGQNFKVSGKADFEGTFHLFKGTPERGSRELKGRFVSPLAGVLVGGNAWRFPNLRGNVRWLSDRLEITDAASGLYGGGATFDYRLAPLGKKDVPTRATWDVTYRDVDLTQLTDFLETRGLRLQGRITGRNRLEWPLGKWSDKVGAGEITAFAPAGVTTMTREPRPDAIAHVAELPPEAGPFNPQHGVGYLPVAGHIVYALDPKWIGIDRSWAATASTYVSFEGRTAYGLDSQMPFHVTSLDWQESDRVLAAIMTAFGAPTGAIDIGGTGEFDGVMLASFSRPTITGAFKGDRMRAWDVIWGHGTAKLTIENSYVTIAESTITSGDSQIQAEGVFSLGYPRKDQGEEINARIRMTRRPLSDLRHAFQLDDWPVAGLVSGEYRLHGPYLTPFGYGHLVIDSGVAYGETFETATSTLRFDGAGVFLDALQIHKSTGLMTGAARVAWDGNYTFSVDASKIPVESLKTMSFPTAPLSGVLQFSAAGTATFADPQYEVTKIRIDDLYAGDEGIGTLSGRLSLRGELLTGNFDVVSTRLNASGSGRIALTDQMDAELTLHFFDTSLDPYLRFFQPALSPYTTAVAKGTVRVVGELADVDHLVVDACVDDLDLKLFDYKIRNDGPIELSLDQHVVRVGRLRLAGEGTGLDLSGGINLHDQTIAVEAAGDANLGILQGFYREIRSSGGATLKAAINGPFAKPVFSGTATIKDGRVRPHFSLPSLEAINGLLSFDAGGIRINDLKARLGDGDVVFGGRIGISGFTPSTLSMTATGNQMRLRYPEGFLSVVDADLQLIGDFASPLLTGRVVVHDSRFTRRFDPGADIFNLGGSTATVAPGAPSASAITLRYDVDIAADQSLRVENNLARLVGSADLKLQGTYEKPVLLGHADIDRGDINFEGNRYLITRGAMTFSNLTKLEPYFDIEAETRVRVPGETYQIHLTMSGTAAKLSLSLDSDPPLGPVDIASLLLGRTSGLQDAELRSFNPSASNQAEQDLLKAMGIQLLAGGVAAPVGQIFQQKLGIDFQIAPSIGSETDPFAPSARVVLGRRLSDRAYVTYTRGVGQSTREEIIGLEYDQSDRVSFVLSQNTDVGGARTYTFDFRVRRVF